MELFELILIILACVAASSVLDQMIPRVSLPLLQIGVGLIIAITIPHLAEVHVDAELFLMLFIAPLLFRDSKETDRLRLWNNKWSILSMAITLVISSVLAAGFILHWIIPSIPLAAAFACAAALGPTDAAAVGAMGASVALTKRQSMLLSGEALINDASGVVSFQFAIAAAVTGAFSAAEAIGSFMFLFFGGIVVGALIGFLAKAGMSRLRRRGYISTTSHVIYEVMSPFLIFLFSEEIHVSGILAVVAAGLVMQEHTGNIKSPETARMEIVSDSVWELIIFLINGTIFVMLGMQLPKVLHADSMGSTGPATAIAAIFAVLIVIIGMRFFWVTVQENIYNRIKAQRQDRPGFRTIVLQSLVTTLAGPKGAVTLSIIMTIPLFAHGADPFPCRDLIIFITSGVILCTLLLADFLLPRLSPNEINSDEKRHLAEARLMVLEGSVQELRRYLDEYPNEAFTPALRLALMRYRVRLMRERFSVEHCGTLMTDMIEEVLEAQQARADEIQKAAHGTPLGERIPYYKALASIRASIGYFGGAEHVGSRFETRKGRAALKIFRFSRQDFDDDEAARIYHDSCMFAIDLEHTAIDHLTKIKDGDDEQRAKIAEVLIEEHETALQSLWSRINFDQDQKKFNADDPVMEGEQSSLPFGLKNNTGKQFRMARRYADEADANAMEIELEQIRNLRMAGKISESAARTLREEVYLMQTSFL